MKTKNIFLTAALVAASFTTYAQVGVGTTMPTTGTALHIDGAKDNTTATPTDVEAANDLLVSVNGFNQTSLLVGFPVSKAVNGYSIQTANRLEVNASNGHIKLKESDIADNTFSYISRNQGKTSLAANDGTTSREIITYLDAGNVGIMNTTPVYRLDVSGDIHTTANLRTDAEVYPGTNIRMNNNVGIYAKNTLGTSGFIMGGVSNDQLRIGDITDNFVSVNLYSNAKTSMVLKDGKVGIGMTPTTSVLEFNAPDNDIIGAVFSKNDNDAYVMKIANGGSSGKVLSLSVAGNNVTSALQVANTLGAQTLNIKGNGDIVTSGNITIGSTGSTAAAGMIKYETGHFYGYNGTAWVQLDN